MNSAIVFTIYSNFYDFLCGNLIVNSEIIIPLWLHRWWWWWWYIVCCAVSFPMIVFILNFCNHKIFRVICSFHCEIMCYLFYGWTIPFSLFAAADVDDASYRSDLKILELLCVVSIMTTFSPLIYFTFYMIKFLLILLFFSLRLLRSIDLFQIHFIWVFMPLIGFYLKFVLKGNGCSFLE